MPPTPTPKPISKPPSKPTAPTAPAPSQPAPSKLGAVKRGRLTPPLRVLIYGQEGVGKTELAGSIPDVLFLDIEGSSAELDVARYPFHPDLPPPARDVADTYPEVLAAVDDLIAHPGHGYGTVAIDTVDALEAKLHAFICQRDKKAGIEGYGFGKGFRVALDELRVLIGRLDVLRRQGVGVLFLGHCGVTRWKNPEGDDYDRYSLRMHALAAGQLKEWADVVGFMHFEGGAMKGADEQRARGWTTNKRMIAFQRDAAWDAKTRIALPPMLEVAERNQWAPIAEARSKPLLAEPAEDRHAAITAELDRLTSGDYAAIIKTAAGTETTGNAVVELMNTTDDRTLERILAGLRATPTPTKETAQ